LNAEGVTGRRGRPFSQQTVMALVHNTAYKGEKGYPAIIDPERYDAIIANLKRLDPTQVAKRRGGRKPVDESYFLRGIVFCQRCGSRMYTVRRAAGRMYICRHRRLSNGICSAPPIPARLIELHVLDHLQAFTGHVESWLQEQVAEASSVLHDRETALQRQRAKLDDLDRVRERHMAEYRKQVEDGASTARIAAEEVERIDRDRALLDQAIREAEAVVEEHAGPPDVDAGLDFYNRLVDHVQGRIRKAEGARALNEALGMVVSGMWAEIEEDRERLLVEFELVGEFEHRLPGGVPILPEFQRRPTLPPRFLDDRMDPEPLVKPTPSPPSR
jgi:Recombinase zinc beta ribbon domain